MNSVFNLFKGVFKPDPPSPLKANESLPQIPLADPKPIPTREQIIDEMEALLLQFVGMGEDGGNTNRADYIDEFNDAVHMAKGSPYCLAAIQWARLQLEKKHDIFFDLPFIASTQNFYTAVKAEYKFKEPKRGRLYVFKSALDSNKGHVGTCLSDDILPTQKFLGMEFNTSGNGSRDGRWQMRKYRSLVSNGSLILLGFVDYSLAFQAKKMGIKSA